MNFSMNYYLNVSLIGSSTKNDRCQDVTVSLDHFENGSLHKVTHNFHLKIRNILELTTCPVKFGTTCPSIIFFT